VRLELPGDRQSEIVNRESPPRSTKTWLIHGESDEVFPVEDVRRLAREFEARGWPVRLSTFAGRGHGFGADQPLLIRAAAEWCAAQLGAGPVVPVNVRPLRLGYWLPLGVLLLGLGWFCLHPVGADVRRRTTKRSSPVGDGVRRRSRECSSPVGDDVRRRTTKHSSRRALQVCGGSGAVGGAARWLMWTAILAATLALLDTGLHLALPRLPVTEGTVRWAERLMVRPELKESFQWLANRAMTVAAQASPGRPALLPGLESDQRGRAALRRGLESGQRGRDALRRVWGAGEGEQTPPGVGTATPISPNPPSAFTNPQSEVFAGG